MSESNFDGEDPRVLAMTSLLIIMETRPAHRRSYCLEDFDSALHKIPVAGRADVIVPDHRFGLD
jgi:hypothetical protein